MEWYIYDLFSLFTKTLYYIILLIILLKIKSNIPGRKRNHIFLLAFQFESHLFQLLLLPHQYKK